jgi:Skp family chaperone for outer membrane proteins
MADQTDIQIPTGDELYNQLMSGIEKDLTTDQLPLLDEKYKNETPDQAEARAARYEKAFAEYDKQLAAYLAQLEAKVRSYQNAARKSLEHEEHEKDEKELSGLEQAISSI